MALKEVDCGLGWYYEVYGAMAGDYSLTTVGHTLIGSSDQGNTFNVSGFDRFILYVPSRSGKILFDAIRLGQQWVNSHPGPDYGHYVSNFNPTGTVWANGEWYIENAPDGQTYENTPGLESFYGFTTFGEPLMTIYLSD